MTQAGDGERAALRGFTWQYKQLAARVYDSLCDGSFVALRLVDPDVGKVDDLVLVTTGGSAGYQYKSEEYPHGLTFKSLLAGGTTVSGVPRPSMLRELADGWTILGQEAGTASVHLCTNKFASANDQLGDDGDPNRPSPGHFAAFLATVLEPLRKGDLALADVPPNWRPTLDKMKSFTGLDDQQFERFLTALCIHVGQPDPLQTNDTTRRADLTTLAGILLNTVGDAHSVVTLDREQMLELAGWAERTRLHSTHQFHVDLDTYEPLHSAVAAFGDLLSHTTAGYLAIVGPPGAGKSTLLTQALSGTEARVIHYYAYIPSLGLNPTRLEAHGFLHDLVLMLDRDWPSRRGHLADVSLTGLRTTLSHQLDEAATTYNKTGQKTLIVVDGLDHVERDYKGNDSFLGELPLPEQIPEGVVFIVGTRTLTPLHAQAREHVEHDRLLNLAQHRLTHDAVLGLCKRAAATGELDRRVHERIAELAAGHPLALGYLLNKMIDVADSDQAMELLEEAVRYDGDIATEYRAIWDQLDDTGQELLAVTARLRIHFTYTDLVEWFGNPAARQFRTRLVYLFRAAGEAWTVFHDSFRQYVIDKSNLDAGTDRTDPCWDAPYHGQIADRCAAATRDIVRWEELYHRHRAGQDIRIYASQSVFRSQTIGLRSPEAVRADIAITLRDAANRRDLVALVAATLAKVELESRLSALEHVDVAGTYMDAGLTIEAVAYSGIDQRRQIPIVQAYALATRLGIVGNPDGRRVFDAIESSGFKDDNFTVTAGHDDDVYEAWAASAPIYRPLQQVLAALRDHWPRATVDDEPRWSGPSLQRFGLVASNICETLVCIGRVGHLTKVEELLIELHETVNGVTDDDQERRATLIAVRLRILEHLLDAEADDEPARKLLEVGLSLTNQPTYFDDVLRWARRALDAGLTDTAFALTKRLPYARRLTTDDLGYTGTVSLRSQFEYWRLRHRLQRHRDKARANTLLDSIPPTATTPAGNRIDERAPVHRDQASIDIATAMDHAVRVAGAAAAASDEQAPYDTARLWADLVPLLEFGRQPTGGGSSTFSGIARQRPELLQIMIDVVATHSQQAVHQFAHRLGSRFGEEPDRWPTELRLRLATRFQSHGHIPDWYRTALVAAEVELRNSDHDITGRLDVIADLVGHHASLGQLKDSRRLALLLIPTSFAVGFRKDHQFKRWTDLFAHAVNAGLADPIAETILLARILRSAAPMTEGAPRDDAARLPGILAAIHPGPAVALFEYLVRNGVVSHLDTLAKLIEGLVCHFDATHADEIEMCVDLVTDVLAAGDTVAHPEVAKAVAAACMSHLPVAHATAIVEEMRARFERYALPTTRHKWLGAIGIIIDPPPDKYPSDSNEYGQLQTTDGNTMTKADVLAYVTDSASLIKLRGVENGDGFNWIPVLERLTPTRDELKALTGLFHRDPMGRTTTRQRHDAEAVIYLGQRWMQLGEPARALECANWALPLTDENAWTMYWGTSRRDAHKLAVSAGGERELQSAWDDLADYVGGAPWSADLILQDLHAITSVIQVPWDPVTVWALVREHLGGMALQFDDEDPLRHQPIRWWTTTGSAHIQRLHANDTASHAFGVLIADHATHVTWMCRNAAIATGSQHIERSDNPVARAIELILLGDPPDDVIEGVGRIAAAGNAGTTDALKRIHERLGLSNSAYIRQLSDTHDDVHLMLPARYQLAMPPGALATIIGDTDLKLGPYEEVVRRLAQLADLEENHLLGHAMSQMRQHRDTHPTHDQIWAALDGSETKFMWPNISVVLARAVAGRMIRDFEAAGYLDGIGTRDQRLFTGFDPLLIGLRRGARPDLVPPAPPAGHDPVLITWLDGSEVRLTDYITALENTDGLVIAATARTTVLNWGHLEEEFSTTLTIGPPADPILAEYSKPRIVTDRQLRELTEETRASPAEPGMHLAVQNRAYRLHQLEASWISFSPPVAASLGWRPVQEEPGTWTTASGEIAVSTIRWVDGWWGHAGPAFDDTEGGGQLVVATEEGAADLAGAYPTWTRFSSMLRSGSEGGRGERVTDERVVVDARVREADDGNSS